MDPVASPVDGNDHGPSTYLGRALEAVRSNVPAVAEDAGRDPVEQPDVPWSGVMNGGGSARTALYP